MFFIEFSIEPQFNIYFSKNEPPKCLPPVTEPYQMNIIYYEW